LNPTLELLRAKRTSALVDARKMEAQLAHLDKEAEAAGVATNLRCIVGMYRDYSATLDEALKLAQLRESERLIGSRPKRLVRFSATTPAYADGSPMDVLHPV
jgi:hypothetical protein